MMKYPQVRYGKLVASLASKLLGNELVGWLSDVFSLSLCCEVLQGSFFLTPVYFFVLNLVSQIWSTGVLRQDSNFEG